jgi:cytochrome P450
VSDPAIADKRAPGPRGLPLLGNLLGVRRDVLGMLVDDRRQFGDVVRFRLGPRIYHLLAHPDQIRQVLVTHHDEFDKATPSSARIRGITGESLLTADGSAWKSRRSLIQPAFQQQQISGYHEGMVAATTELLDERLAPAAAAGRPVDMASEMMRLTFTIVARALFGADVRADVEQVGQAASVVMAHTYRRLEQFLPLPLWLPTPGNVRFRRQLSALDRLVERIISERIGTGNDADETSAAKEKTGWDVVSRLLAARDGTVDAELTNRQLRNETIALLLAGHETTANALTWTWHLLAKHPEAAARLRSELMHELGNRPPSFDDLPKLHFARRVLQESMRLYPPIWIMERHVRAHAEIGGYRIPAGTSLVISPYVTHRHTEFWPDAERFDPDRFAPEAAADRPALAYLPFGAGPRLCVGHHFAMNEALLILAMIAGRFRMTPVPGVPIVPQPGITLRTKHGLPIKLTS